MIVGKKIITYMVVIISIIGFGIATVVNADYLPNNKEKYNDGEIDRLCHVGGFIELTDDQIQTMDPDPQPTSSFDDIPPCFISKTTFSNIVYTIHNSDGKIVSILG